MRAWLPGVLFGQGELLQHDALDVLQALGRAQLLIHHLAPSFERDHFRGVHQELLDALRDGRLADAEVGRRVGLRAAGFDVLAQGGGVEPGNGHELQDLQA